MYTNLFRMGRSLGWLKKRLYRLRNLELRELLGFPKVDIREIRKLRNLENRLQTWQRLPGSHKLQNSTWESAPGLIYIWILQSFSRFGFRKERKPTTGNYLKRRFSVYLC